MICQKVTRDQVERQFLLLRSFVAVGNNLAISRERVRQIINKSDI
jgi:DNA-directed RNA polymerase sigma subunit (sigma70/sigma32)